MNWLDIVILVVVGIATFLGLKIGIIKAALSLAGVIAGVILAGRFYEPLAEKMTFIQQANVAEIVAFAIILIGVMLIAGILAAFLKKVVSVVMLGWVNHLGGGIFGFVLGAILSAALLAIWGKFFDVADIISHSGIAAVLLDYFPAVLTMLPEEFDTIRSFFE
jgi:membrane protein required for colicin V production